MTVHQAKEATCDIVERKLKALLAYCGNAIAPAEADSISRALRWMAADLCHRVMRGGVDKDGMLLQPDDYDQGLGAFEVCYRIKNRHCRRLFEQLRDAVSQAVGNAIRAALTDIIVTVNDEVIVRGVEDAEPSQTN